MFKKYFIIFIILVFVGINFSNILVAKAQFSTEELKVPISTLKVESPTIPSSEQMNEMIEAAPESYNVSLEEIIACNSGIYDAITGALNNLKSIIFNPVCQILGRVVGTAPGAITTPITGMCTINTGGADTDQKCKEWVQKQQKEIKAKKAQATKMAFQYAARYFMDQLVSDTVNWIGGKEGKPQFITNWNAFFKNVADESFGVFIQNSPFADLCEPIRYPIRVNVQTQMPGEPPFPTCTLSQVVSNIDSFYQDFNNGGWLAFEESSYPWNNDIGASILVNENLNYQLEQAKQEAEKETQSGYEPTKYCVQTATDKATGKVKCVKEVVSIPGDIKSDLASKAVTQQLDKTDKYFLDSKDLDNYGRMISDALVNRLVKSAKEKLIDGKHYGKGLLGANFLTEETKPANVSLGIKYSCKKYGGYKSCEIDPNGSYTDPNCGGNCGGFSTTYNYNSQTGYCVSDTSGKGEYKNYESCLNAHPLPNISHSNNSTSSVNSTSSTVENCNSDIASSCFKLLISSSDDAISCLKNAGCLPQDFSTSTSTITPSVTPSVASSTAKYSCQSSARTSGCIRDDINGEYTDLEVCQLNCANQSERPDRL